MEYKLYLDTNALLDLQEKVLEEPFVISQMTLHEIENIKSSNTKDGDLKYKARHIAHILDENDDKYEVVPLTVGLMDYLYEHKGLEKTPDNIIVASAYYYQESHQSPVLFVTNDVNLKFISKKVFGLRTKSANELHLVDNEGYTGYKVVVMDDLFRED